MNKLLTYLTILAITVLPVQLISASAETLSMQMIMSQPAVAKNECLPEKMLHHTSLDSEKNAMGESCCDDNSHECQSCDNCPQAVSAMFSSFDAFVKVSVLKAEKYFTSYLSLNGVSQENLLRPPRTFI